MTLSDGINLGLTVLSLVLAIISIVIVILTLKQNNKMIENSSRPYVVVYGEMTNFSDLTFYIVLKNYGNSGAIIKKIVCDLDLSKYNYDTKITPFEAIDNTLLAPNHNIVYAIDHQQLNSDNIEYINFEIEYQSLNGKIYKEKYPINYTAFKKNITIKSSTKDKELRTISYTLQEMVQKDL